MLPRFLARTLWQWEDLEVVVTLSGFPSPALAEAHALAATELRLRSSQLVLLMDDGTEHYLREEDVAVRQVSPPAKRDVLSAYPTRLAPGGEDPLSWIEREEERLGLFDLVRRTHTDLSFQLLAYRIEPETPESSLSEEVIAGAIHPLGSDLHAAGWSEQKMHRWLQDHYSAFRVARARGELQTPEETARWVEERLSTFPSP